MQEGDIVMGGRSTEYTDEIAEQALAYINGGWEKEGHAIPSIVGLCKVIKRARSTIYKWAEDKDNPFSDMLEESKETQEFVTLNKSLMNEFNPTISKLILAKHGYHDKQDNQLTGKDGVPLMPDSIKVVYE